MRRTNFLPLDEDKLQSIPEFDYKKLRKKISELRDRNMMLDQSMATILDMQPQNFGKFLRGEVTKPTIRGIYRLAKYFDLSLSEVFDLPEKDFISEDAKDKEIKTLKEHIELLKGSLQNCMKLNKMLEDKTGG